MTTIAANPGPPAPTSPPPRRPPHGPVRPLRRRDVGAVQLLRDAGPAGPLPDPAPQLRPKDAKALYATYTGLVYLTPLLGGFLADKLLGQRKAILIGGIVMAMGHFAMAFESMLYLALSLLIIGNGFFKPNISTMVGNLYPQGDAAARRGLHDLLHRDQPRRLLRPPGVRGPRREPEVRLALRLRPGRGRDDLRPDLVPRSSRTSSSAAIAPSGAASGSRRWTGSTSPSVADLPGGRLRVRPGLADGPALRPVRRSGRSSCSTCWDGLRLLSGAPAGGTARKGSSGSGWR